MENIININQPAKNLDIEKWVQGENSNIEDMKGYPILIEVFQVNCPGCFLYGIPEAIRFHKLFKDKGLKIVGLATAFEDFDKNTIENLELLAKESKIIGHPREILKAKGIIDESSTLPYKIPFPLAQDAIEDMGNFTIGKTFFKYGLEGTPSAILIDKKGIVRHKIFGYNPHLENFIKELVEE